MIIETQRLYLREMEEDDFDALYMVLADSDIMRHYPYTFDENRVRNWIARNIERYRIFGFGLWAVCLKDTGEIIGDCGLTMQTINGQIKPEIGYHIRADQQKKDLPKKRRLQSGIGRFGIRRSTSCIPICCIQTSHPVKRQSLTDADRLTSTPTN